MKSYSYREGIRYCDGECVVAIGLFDGVHLGHRQLFTLAKQKAEEMKLPFGVFTFDIDSEIKPGRERLYSGNTRRELLEEIGVDFTVSAKFSEIASMSPEEFVTRILIDSLGARVAAIGFNFRFGRGAIGDCSLLKKLMKDSGGDAIICDDFTVNGTTVSTTRIKELLADGEIRQAGELLGSPYRLEGTVSQGNKVGRLLGFPTVNTEIESGLAVPKKGVYRTAVVVGEKIYAALTNVGTCPTFTERTVHAETYILNFAGDLYGENIKIYFCDYLREEKRFTSEKELKMQINIDINKILNEYGEIKWQELGLS